MSNVKSASIFLNGTYPEEHLVFYREAVANNAGKRLLIAADGGLELFVRLGLSPDLIVGDFDSVKPETLERFTAVETIRYPREKDATDGELALRAALDRGCFDIDLYGTHAMIGWGHRNVYRNARTLGDVRSGDIASAIIGSDETNYLENQ